VALHPAPLLLLLLCLPASAQNVPQTSEHPWQPPTAATPKPSDLKPSAPETPIDPTHPYTLPELIDLAEKHNPDTRVVWQQARVRAAGLHIAQADLLPTLTAVALANTTRQGVLFGPEFARQTLGIFEPLLRVNYSLFDPGRSDRIAAAREQLLASSFAFNTTHLNILFETSRRYYRLLNAVGQRDAAEATLKNAQTVERAVNARLDNGLATLPDALEARSAAAQADFEFQAALGEIEIARGALLQILGASPYRTLQVQPLEQLTVPDQLDDAAQAAIDRALAQRPEIAQRVAERRAAQDAIRQARSAYIPSLDFQGEGGEVRAYGRQNQYPGGYAGPLEVWNVNLNLHWNLFDGGRREADLARSHAEERRAQAEIDTTRDDIEQQVWAAYVDLQTALRQRRAAASLLSAASASYDAAVKSYGFGLRNTVDVVTAQRTLAQALSQDVAARTGVLTQFANFAFRTGDLLRTPTPPTRPTP
jgi:outer membrane protein